MIYDYFVCLNCKTSLCLFEEKNLRCPACQVQYPLIDGIPVIFPQEELKTTMNGKQYSVSQISVLYNQVYSHVGLMGTDLDKTYDAGTKKRLLGFAGSLPGKRMLDIGSGAGNLWEYVPAGVKGFALDISNVGVGKAIQRYPGLTGSASVGEALPYADAFFDVVVAADTIEHTFSPERTLGEVQRVLKPGGVFCASFPTPNSLRKWGRNQLKMGRASPRFLFNLIWVMVKRLWFFGRTVFQPIDRDLDIQAWKALLEKGGFEVVEMIEWPPEPETPIVYLVHCRTRDKA